MERFTLRQMKPASIETGYPELICASIYAPECLQIKDIFSQYYPLDEIVGWFNENLHFILNEAAPNFLPKAICLAEATDMFYELLPYIEDDDDSFDSVLDSMYEYMSRHNLRSAFQGTDVPSVLLGIYDGNLTVSWKESDMYLSFYIDTFSLDGLFK
jgi:hypothetical protein